MQRTECPKCGSLDITVVGSHLFCNGRIPERDKEGNIIVDGNGVPIVRPCDTEFFYTVDNYIRFPFNVIFPKRPRELFFRKQFWKIT